MRRKKSNKTLYVVGIVFLAALLVAGGVFLLNMNKVSESAFFYSDEGLITIDLKEKSILTPTKQRVTFERTSVNLGEQVVANDVFQSIATNAYSVKVLIEIKRNDGNWGKYTAELGPDYNFPFAPGDYTTTIRFTPNEPGNYQARTTYWLVSCPPGSVGGAGCQSSLSLPGTIIEGGSNSVTVIDNSPPQCTKNERWTDWSTYQSIVGGSQDVRTFQTVDSSCNYVNGNQEYRTQCYGDYKIEETQETIASGLKACELSGGEGNTECSANVEITCTDGSKIITQVCVSGTLVDTNNKCQDDNVCYGITSDNKCNEVQISADKTCAQANYYDSLEACTDNLEQDINYLLWFLIVAAVIFMMVIVAVVIRRRR